MKLTIIILLILTSCVTQRQSEKAYICTDQHKTITGVSHTFENLTHTKGRVETPDSAVCNVGDTLIIKDFKRRVYFFKP